MLIDFDVSRVSNPDHNTDTRIMGTIGYAAPEQFGFSQTDARADLYAAGMMFNEMITGQHPSRKLVKGLFRPVVEQCIEVNVGKRYHTAAELRAAVARRLHYGKRRRARLALAGIAAVIALALGIYFGFRPEPVRPQIALSTEMVPSVPRGFTTPFTYDLDGDGTEEEYIFGTFHQSVPAGHRDTITDSFRLVAGEEHERVVFPCVWKTEADGTLSPVPEFAERLTQPQIQLCRTEGNESPAPAIYEAEEEIWQGGVQVLFTLKNQGSWYYSASATLDGQLLTAATMSHVSDANKPF